MPNQKLELTWIGKETRPRLELIILSNDIEKIYHAKYPIMKSSIKINKKIEGEKINVMTSSHAPSLTISATSVENPYCTRLDYYMLRIFLKRYEQISREKNNRRRKCQDYS
jgi:adenine-specific DNA-methyltransferase